MGLGFAIFLGMAIIGGVLAAAFLLGDKEDKKRVKMTVAVSSAFVVLVWLAFLIGSLN